MSGPPIAGRAHLTDPGREDLVICDGAVLQHRPELLPVDGFRDGGAAVPDQA
jgi:hypothetical protein